MKFEKVFLMEELKAPSPLHSALVAHGYEKNGARSLEQGFRQYTYSGPSHSRLDDLGKHLEGQGFEAGHWLYPDPDHDRKAVFRYHKDDPDGATSHAQYAARYPAGQVSHAVDGDTVSVFHGMAVKGWKKNDATWRHAVRVQDHPLTGPVIRHEMGKQTMYYGAPDVDPYWHRSEG